MFTPNFNQDQYIDADSLNTAAGSVSGSIASGLIASCFPGLVSDNSASFSSSGLSVSAYLPAPFGVIFGTGVLSNAHGTISNADTQTYVVSFSGMAPVSGSPITAYLVASYQQIQQTAIAITGPPPGHPDYNPNFVPYTGYQTNVDSLAVSATLTPADNSTTFELFRTTLASGASGLGILNTTYQQRRAPHAIFQLKTPAVTGVLTPEAVNYLSVSGTYTLPPASGANTQLLSISSSVSGACTITTSGTDLIYGLYPTPASGIPNFSLTDGNAITLGATNGVWQILQGTAGALGGASPYGGNPVGVISGGYLTVTSATVLTFARTIGTQVPINGVFQTIPLAGITISNAGLANSTLYYVYVEMVGSTMTLVLSPTGWVFGPNGYPVQNGDSTKSLLGMVYTSASGQFVPISIGSGANASSNILCLNYYNRVALGGYASVLNGNVTSVYPTFVEINSSYRVNCLSWNVNVLTIGLGQGLNNTGNDNVLGGIGLDGSLWSSVTAGGVSSTAGFNMTVAAFGNLTVTEGYHYFQIFAAVGGGGTGTLSAFDITPSIMG